MAIALDLLGAELRATIYGTPGSQTVTFKHGPDGRDQSQNSGGAASGNPLFTLSQVARLFQLGFGRRRVFPLGVALACFRLGSDLRATFSFGTESS